jgi:probable F420-dependent oxidoreductase
MATAEGAQRFGVVLISSASTRAEWVDKCRRAESLGYDVIAAPDHLNLLGPFPSAMLAAEVTERPRIGTYVLNACFHNSALLARDIATTDHFVEGRMELGVGTGYVEPEFTATKIPFGSPGSRVDRLEALLDDLETHFAHGDQPRSLQQPRPPLLIGGHGDRVLRLAARRAQIVSFTGAGFRPEYGRTALANAAEILQKVKLVRAEAGQRAAGLELNVLVKAVTLTQDRRSAAEAVRRYGPELTTDQLLEVPTLLIGTAQQIAEQVRQHSATFGITYFTVMEPAMEDFGKVIELLR